MKTVEMNKIKLTKSMEKFLFNDVLPNYIIYSKKDNYAYCTACQNEVPLPDTTRPKMEVTCPICKHKAFLKAKGQTKYSFGDEGVGIIIDKDKDLCVRYFDVQKRYKPDGTVTYYGTKECLREYIAPDGKLIAYDNTWNYGWKRCNTRAYSNYRGVAGEPCYHINTNWKIRANYTKNLKRVTKGTKWEHSCLNEIMKMHNSHHYWDTYRTILRDYAKCPYFEYLYKVGFQTLLRVGAFERILPFDLTQKTLPDIMMVRKELYNKMLQNGNPTYDDLVVYQDMTKFNLATEEDYEIWKKYFGRNRTYRYIDETDPARRFREVFKKSWQKLDKYATETKDFKIGLYEDYLKMCSDLNYDMNNTFVLFPKHLKESHDMLVDIWNTKKDEEAVKKAKTRNKEYETLRDAYNEQFAFKENNLQIIVPNGCEDICLEGQKLRHCVGTYIDKVCKGISIILFVRNITQIGVPFYTMEVSGNKIIQCRGFKNGEVTDEVRRFLHDFAMEKQLTMNYIA